MEHVKYKEWTYYSLSFLEIFKVGKKKLLDLACGTGTPTILLSEITGSKILGIDKSFHMIKVAKKKTKERRMKNIHFAVYDMRFFYLKEKFNACFCFFDSLNYIIKPDELKRVFENVHRILEEKGIFAFDMNTIFALRELWNTKTEVKKHKGFKSIWKNVWREDEKISELYIEIEWEEKGIKKNIKEFHREKGYEIDEVVSLLKGAGFKKVFFYEHLKYTYPTPFTPRVQFVAQK